MIALTVRKKIEKNNHRLGQFALDGGSRTAVCEYCGGRVTINDEFRPKIDKGLLLPCTAEKVNSPVSETVIQ